MIKAKIPAYLPVDEKTRERLKKMKREKTYNEFVIELMDKKG